MGYPGGSDGKESACNARDLGSIPGLERSPIGGLGNPLQYSCLENPHGQRSLADYSSRGHKELDTTERLSTAQHTCIISTAGKLHTQHIDSKTKQESTQPELLHFFIFPSSSLQLFF